MIQFSKQNIKEDWEWNLINEFPEFFLDVSPYILEWYEKYHESGDIPKLKEDLINLRYSFEFGEGWKIIVKEHLQGIKELIRKANSNGHEVFYKGCILKQKWHTCRDQGDWYGKDSKLYSSEYGNLVEDLYFKSQNINEKTGEFINSVE